MVNCDGREKEYKEHIKKMDWCNTLPYDADPELIAKIEDAANADVIPKIAVFNIQRGFEKPVVGDIKVPVLKSSVADAITKVNQMILDGEEALNQELAQKNSTLSPRES